MRCAAQRPEPLSARLNRNNPVPLPPLYAVRQHALVEDFPSVREALHEPNGLLAMGGGLSATRLLQAYRQGIFPWYSEGEPILWWSPDPRCVLFPERLRTPRGIRRDLRRLGHCRLSRNQAFEQVLRACAKPAPGRGHTWITRDMTRAYLELHRLGHCWSVELWDEAEKLIGGLYGVRVGNVFSGESMFSRRPGASRAALLYLLRQSGNTGIRLLDCQMSSSHLERMGAALIPRANYRQLLREEFAQAPLPETTP